MKSVRNILSAVFFAAMSLQIFNAMAQKSASQLCNNTAQLGLASSNVSQAELYCPIYANSCVNDECRGESTATNSLDATDSSNTASIQSQVAELAEVQELGRKTANLVILDQKVNKQTLKSELDKIGFTVAVPEFVGIPSNRVQNLLNASGFDLNGKWPSILEKAGINENVMAECFKNQTLPEKFISELKSFAYEIETQFNSIAKNVKAYENQGWVSRSCSWIKSLLGGSDNNILSAKIALSTDAALGTDISKLLDIAQKNNWHLMVRSTGKEDTKQCPNAGGNKSVANVKPTKANLIRAIGQVIVSYFFDTQTQQPKSLMQRLKCGDKTIFDSPFTPVLIQRMIGENFGSGSIPVGCVVYTQESEGNTPGVTSLQCSFGHPEGVVESSVGIDTCFVDENKNYHCIIKVKPTRLVPECEQDKCKLVSKTNAESMINSPALDKDAIIALQIIAAKIQKIYGQAMDLELVYQPEDKTIYLVQARPVTEIKLKPEYIKDISGISPDNIVEGLTICTANASVRFINSPKEIILAPTLDDALTIFNDPKNTNRELAKAVVVARDAESTSHAAAVFRGSNLPIMIAHDYSKVVTWVQSGAKLVIDAQREIIVNINTLESAPVSTGIITGWFTHPLPNKISISDHSGPDRSASNSGLSQKNLQSGSQNIPAENLMPEVSMENLVELLKEADSQTAHKALSTIIFRIEDQIKQMAEKGTCTENPVTVWSRILSLIFNTKINCHEKLPAQKALQLLENLKSYVAHVATQINQGLSLPDRDIKRLYPINWLEALLFQQESKTIVDAYSLDSIIQNFDKIVNFISTKLKPLLKSNTGSSQISSTILQNWPALNIAYKGSNVALTPELENEWIIFVDAIYQQDKTVTQEFETFISEIENLDILATWLNFAFSTQQKDLAALARFKAITAEFSKSIPYLNFIKEHKQRLDSYDLSKWQDPANFATQLKNLQAIVSSFTCEQFRGLNSQYPLVKLSMIQTMDQFVELFDQSIKSLKSSTLYSNPEDQVINFKLMLHEYFNLLNEWIRIVPEMSLKYNPKWPLDKYLDKIKEILSKLENSAQQLAPTPEFSVANAAIGSTTEFRYNFPTHAEDIFTLIHQNSLVTLGALTKTNIDQNWPKPNLFKQTEAELLKLNSETNSIWDRDKAAWLIGLKISNNLLTARYNLPLREHSMVFELSFDKLTGKTFLSIRFVGLALNRWAFIKYFLEIKSNLLGILLINDINIGPNELTIKHEISSDLDISNLTEHLDCIIAATNLGIDPIVNYFVKLFKQKAEYLDKFIALDINTSSWEQEYVLINIYKALVGEGFVQLFDQAAKAATSAMKSENWNVRYSSVNIYKLFVEKCQGQDCTKIIDQALNTAILAIQDTNSDVESAGKELLEFLVEKCQAQDCTKIIDQVINTAALAMKSEKWIIRRSGPKLLKPLVEKCQGQDCSKITESAINAALLAIQDTEWMVQNAGFDLFKLLIEKCQGQDCVKIIDQAINTAALAMKSENGSVQYSGLKLVNLLAEKCQGQDCTKVIELAVNSVSSAIKSEFWQVRNAILETLKFLVAKCQGQDCAKIIDQALNTAILAIQDTNSDVESAGKELLEFLVEKCQAQDCTKIIDQVINTAALAMKSEKWIIRRSGPKLLKPLVEKCQGQDCAKIIEQAFNFAVLTMQDTDSDVQDAGLELLKTFFEKCQGQDCTKIIEQVANAATLAMKSENWRVQYSGLKLVNLLIEKCQGQDCTKVIELAVNSVSSAIKSEFWQVRNAILETLKLLVEKCQEQDCAKIIELAINSAALVLQDTDTDVQIAGLNIFKLLFEKCQGQDCAKIIEQVTNAAVLAMKSEKGRVRRSGLKLSKFLFEKCKEQDCTKIIELAYNNAALAIQDTDPNVQDAGFDLFDLLIEKCQVQDCDKIIEQVTNAATLAMKSENSYTQYSGIKLSKLLVEKCQGKACAKIIELASIAASLAMKNEDGGTRDFLGINLYRLLIEKCQEQDCAKIIDLAVNAAAFAIKGENWRVQYSGLRLVNLLIEKCQGQDCTKVIELAVNSVSSAIKSEFWQVRNAILETLKLLVEKCQGQDCAKIIELAYNNAALVLQDTDTDVQIAGFNIFKLLFEKCQGQDCAKIIEQVTNAAGLAIKSIKWRVRFEGLKLFKLLIEKCQGQDCDKIIESASKAAELAQQDTDSDVRDAGKYLLKAIELHKK